MKEKDDKPTSREQLGILLHPKNLVKTVAAALPGAGAAAEILNQLEGAKSTSTLVILRSPM